MSLSVHQVAVPTFTRMLKNLSAILQKGLAHAEAKEIDPSVLINSRLALDMLPLVRQIQIATNTAKNAVSELAGVEAPEYEDDEVTFADLFARIDKTIDHLETFEPEQFDGAENKKVTLKAGETSIEFKGFRYLMDFAMSNFYFHVTTAYNILRHNGVEIGKRDFLGSF